MKYLAFISLLTLATPGLANNPRFKVETVDSAHCRVVGHPDQYVRSYCDQIKLNGGDQVEVSGIYQRSNLVINQGHQNNNPYYMPLGVSNANHSVSGDIQVVQRRNLLGQMVQHALIYRLDYKTYKGQTGFQIITIRIGTGLRSADKTCTMYSFDSNNSTLFTHIPETKREAAMRAQALRQVRQSDFQSASNRCMLFEHSHGEHRTAPVQLPANLEEDAKSSASRI